MTPLRASGRSRPPGASPIALVAALEVERRALQGRLTHRAPAPLAGLPIVTGRLGGRCVVLVQAGLGAERAREAALLVGPRFTCAAVWSLGLAGGLDPALRAGDLLVPDLVLTPHGPPLACAVPDGLRRASQELPVHRGGLVSVLTPALTPAHKQALRAATGARAVDMEAAGIAAAAGVLGIPWLAFKAVLDPADVAVPPFFLAGAAPDGALRPWALLPAAFWSGHLRVALRLARLSRRALRRLAQGAERAVAAWPRLDATGAVQ